MSIPKHVLLFFSIVLSLSLKAQVYPVQGNVVLNPPYSPYLADLTALGSQRFWLTLRMQDPTIASYNCKLRLTIEGVGITLRTKNTFLPPPITLEGGGIPQFFYGDDLAAYFNPANLDFSGLTRSQYERTQRLPEGVYRFTIEVLDYNRGTVVSNKIGTTAWIVLNEPPILNMPANTTKITILEPTNIPFTWTPRHTGSPNAAFTTNYTFKMVELAPNATSQSANAAFLSQPVLYETTLSQNQFVYGPAEPTLMAGRKYAWQVQATDTEGRDLFRNNGKSEVFVFQYGDALGIPRNVLQQGGNATTLSLQWELPIEGEMPAQYRIRYKPLTSPANNYFESVTPNRYFTLGELNPSTNYLVQVRSERGSIFSEYSAPLQMSTTSLEDRPYTCGQAPVLTPPTTTEILQRLFPGDEIKMHDFRVTVTTVEGSNGNYSGTGLMRVSLFNNASVKVRFSGRVNTNYELVGEIVSTYAKGNAIRQLVDEMEKIGADRNTAQNNARDTIAMPVAIIIIGIIDSVWVQDSTIVVLKEDGTQEEIARPQAQDGTPQQVVLTDSEGNSYTVNEEGEVINNGSSATSSVASTVHYKVNFSSQEDQDYGFDAKVHEVLNHYETTSIEGDTYTIPWKSVETGRFDKVKVTATVPRENLIQEVGFSADAASLPKQQGENANEIIVTLQGKAHEHAEQISAYLNQENTADSTTNRLEVGKLNVISYNKAYKRLILISVNGAQLPIQKETLQTELNDIYKQAIVQWQVEPVQSLTEIVYDTDNNGLEYGNSSWFSNYTGEMRTIINTYLQNRSLMPDTYYLFIVPKTDDAQVMGFMPRKKQMGFICSEKVNSTNITKTIAHELAHGAFRLEHSFPPLPEQGDNLMDYSATGKNLFKTQWDYIHNPVAMLGLFDGDEEGAMVLPCWGWFDDCDDVVAILKGIKARVGLSLPSLPLFKPDPSRNRGSEYVGYSIEMGGETYAKITIKNEIKRDTTINAENYLDYESQEGDKTYVGFMYKPNDESYFKILLSNENDTASLNLKREKLRQFLFSDHLPSGSEKEKITECSSDFCCTKCGRDLAMSEDRLAEIFPSVVENKQEYVDAFNVCLQEEGFEYNSCDRQAKIFAQIAIETNNLKAKTEGKGKTWKLTGDNELLTYFKATLKAKQRWFNQDFWDTKLYKDFCQIAYYEKKGTKETIPIGERYKVIETTDCYGYYNGAIQSHYLVKVPTKFVLDSAGEFKMYSEPTSAQKLQIEKNIFNYAYGGPGSLGNGDYLSTNDGFDFRGRGAIQLTGRDNYQALSLKLQTAPYSVNDVDIVTNPNAVAEMPKLVLYSAFIHFKGQLKNDIKKLDELSIEKVSALVNTGNENGTANHSDQRTTKYNSLRTNEFKCDD